MFVVYYHDWVFVALDMSAQLYAPCSFAVIQQPNRAEKAVSYEHYILYSS